MLVWKNSISTTISSELQDCSSWIFLLWVIFPYSVRLVDIIYRNNSVIYVLTNCFDGNIIGTSPLLFGLTCRRMQLRLEYCCCLWICFSKIAILLCIFKLLSSKIFLFTFFCFLSFSYSYSNLALIKSTDSCNLFMCNWDHVFSSFHFLTGNIHSDNILLRISTVRY